LTCTLPLWRKKNNLTVSIVNGGNLSEVAKALDGVEFQGSVIA